MDHLSVMAGCAAGGPDGAVTDAGPCGAPRVIYLDPSGGGYAVQIIES